MTPDGLHRIGQRLYGHRWKAPLAREIGVVRQTVSAWANGKAPIPERAAKTIALLAERVRPLPYKEKRPRANGRQVVLEGEDEAAAILIHGDARSELSHSGLLWRLYYDVSHTQNFDTRRRSLLRPP